MKRNILFAAAIGCIAASASMSSCDSIAEADRFSIDHRDTITFTPGDTVKVWDGTDSLKVVMEHKTLIEDYTGWKCVNCPVMAAFIETKITTDYPCIVVGMHPEGNLLSNGQVMNTNPANTFSTVEAKNYAATLGNITGLPSVVVNRTKQDGNYAFAGTADATTNALRTAVMNNYLQYNAASANLIGLALYTNSTDGNTFSIKTAIRSYNAPTAPLKLMLWVMESHITGFQVGATVPSSYEHNHVFRKCVNDIEGETIALTQEDEYATVIENTLTTQELWVKENCEVVGVIYNADTQEVLNVAKTSLK